MILNGLDKHNKQSNNNCNKTCSKSNSDDKMREEERKLPRSPFETSYTIESKFQRLGSAFEKYLLDIQRNPENSPCQLHSYQVDAVLNTHRRILQDREERVSRNLFPEAYTSQSVKPVLIVAPTGAGKSGMIALLPYLLRSAKVLVLTPSKVISEQLCTALGGNHSKKSFYEVSGICNDKVKLAKWLEPVTVIRGPDEIISGRLGNMVIVNAQKFAGRSTTTLSLQYRNEAIISNVLNFFPQFDTLIVDEAHHFPAKTWVSIVNTFSDAVSDLDKKIIFLTATPHRQQSNGELVPILGEGQDSRIAITITQKQVMGNSIRFCEFVEEDQEATPENVTDDIIQIFGEQQEAENRFRPQGLVLVRTREEVVFWTEELNTHSGDKNFAISLMSTDRPTENLEKFNAGSYRLGVTCGLLLEGYDNSNVTLCVILRNVRTKTLFTQFIGRCMRLKRFPPGEDGKTAKTGDRTIGVILSYAEFNQMDMWLTRESLASDHPMEVEDDEPKISGVI